MSFYRCLDNVMRAIGRRISVDEFDRLYERLDAERNRLMRAGYPADWLQAAETVSRQIETERAVAQRQIVRNRLAHAQARAFLGDARGQGLDAGQALEALLVGVNIPIEGGRLSISSETQGLWNGAVGALFADLRRADGGNDRLLKLFSEPSYELEIAKALRGENASPEAQAIAKSIEKVREDLRRQENDAGGWRGKLDGYVTRQSHDSARLRAVGFEAWRDYILPRLDQAKTFDRDADLIAQLRLERGKLLQQRFGTLADLQELQANLGVARKIDRKVDQRVGRQEDNLDAMRTTFEAALTRYLELQGRGASADGEAARLEARRDMANARAGLRHLERKIADLRRHQPELAARIEQEAGELDRIEQGLDLLNELDGKLRDYETRLRQPADAETMLRRVYNAVTADTWLARKTEEFDGVLSKIGPASIAKQRAAHRELHFATAEAEVEYMRRFGTGGLADSVFSDLESAARAIAVMRRLGPNPEAMFQQLRTELLREARDTGDDKLAKAVSRKRLDWELAEVLGQTRGTHDPRVAAWGSGIRAIESMAKLGGALISSIGDPATLASELRYQGKTALSAHSETLQGLMQGRRGGERRVIADLLGVGFETLTGQILSRVGGESAPPGWMAKSMQFFFRANGLAWWTDTHKTTAGLVTSRFFALQADKPMAELPSRTARLLRQFGIEDADWEIMRNAALHQAEDGTAFLTPEGIRTAPLGEFMNRGAEIDQKGGDGLWSSERALREARDRLVAKYQALIADRVDYAIPTPGGRERAMIHMGTERGDVLGETLRFVMQFKGFPIAMTAKVLGREAYGYGPGKLGAAGRLAAMALQMTVLGYMAMSAKELLQGKTVRDPVAPDTWVASFIQGGGAGIMGDFVFGEFNRFGRSALSTAAGPTLGTTDDLFELWAKARSGEDFAAQALRTATANTPFASLFYVRPALNYLFLYSAQEALNPGFLRRMERRVEKENKQTFWLSPQEAPQWR